jgi:hypothetical protein
MVCGGIDPHNHNSQWKIQKQKMTFRPQLWTHIQDFFEFILNLISRINSYNFISKSSQIGLEGWFDVNFSIFFIFCNGQEVRVPGYTTQNAYVETPIGALAQWPIAAFSHLTSNSAPRLGSCSFPQSASRSTEQKGLRISEQPGACGKNQSLGLWLPTVIEPFSETDWAINVLRKPEKMNYKILKNLFIIVALPFWYSQDGTELLVPMNSTLPIQLRLL